MVDRYPCPCCGHLVFDEPPGTYCICPICFWEDDVLQLVYPLMGGGPNALNLCEAQREYARCGACEARLVPNVRRPEADELLDPTWRPFDSARDPYLRLDSAEDGELWQQREWDVSGLYYWREDY